MAKDALLGSVESVKEERTSKDVLWEIALKFGLDLSTNVDPKKIDGHQIQVVAAGALFACLDETISSSAVEAIAGLLNEHNPETVRVVLRDSGFKDDVAKTNAIQILRQRGIEDVKTI